MRGVRLLEEWEQRWVQVGLELFSSVHWERPFLYEGLQGGHKLGIVLLHGTASLIPLVVGNNLIDMLKSCLRLVRIVWSRCQKDIPENRLANHPKNLSLDVDHRAILVQRRGSRTKCGGNNLTRGRLVCKVEDGRGALDRVQRPKIGWARVRNQSISPPHHVHHSSRGLR